MEAALTALATGDRWPLGAEQIETDSDRPPRPVRIGRDPAVEVPLPFKTMSRVHAVLEYERSQWFIRDADSRNGTVVNAEPVGADLYPLRDGDQIVVGGVVTLEFTDPTTASNTPTTARAVGVWIDPKTGLVWVDGQPVDPPLSTRQRKLLTLLYRHEGRQVPLNQAVAEVFPGMKSSRTDALLELAARLAHRLRPLTSGADYLEVARGHSLRLRKPE